MRKQWIWILIIVLCLAILACALFVIQLNSYGLSLDLLGEPLIAIEVGDTFSDPGAKAESYDWLRGERVAPVSCRGTVDTSKAGIYELTYEAQFHGIVRSVSRQVHVVDSLDPVIILQYDPDAYTLPGDEYVEEGYTATDWFDGDITHLVQRTEVDGKVIYSVTSSSGRSTTVERTIFYNDPMAPELTLNEGNTLTIGAGQPFVDPGFTATDNVDGDLTAQVQVSGHVDIYSTGNYELTYTVTDAWGNTTTAVRTVVVDVTMKNPSVSTGKVIYLTFDDGPSDYTDELLDILAKYDVKATFFVVNTGAIAITGRMAAEGHTVAIHSATHNYSYIYANEDNYYADLYKMQSIIAQYTGETSYLVRFPGGSSNTVSRRYNKGIMSRLTVSLKENGYKYFDWNVDSNDAGGASTSDEVFRNVVNGVSGRKTAIVLQHDTQLFSINAVERIIIWGLANGYTFLPLTSGSPTCAHGVAN